MVELILKSEVNSHSPGRSRTYQLCCNKIREEKHS